MVELRMVSFDELRARVAAWMEAGGSAQLAIAALEAKRAQEQIREALRADYDTLSEPMTI